MTLIFHPEAQAEFMDSIEFYESRSQGLGEDFASEVFYAIQNILSYPHAWPVIEGEIRRCLTHRFPYGILYSIEPDNVFILSVMHLHRHPDYWKKRR